MEPLAVSSAAEEEQAGERATVELADVFRLYGESYRLAHPLLPASHVRVMRAIELCRTAALGGHLERCPECGFERPAYDSCRNRHCPKCQALAKAKWLLAREAELLPVPYFHAVFTLPHELNPLVLANLRPLVGLLFHGVSQTLLTFGRNELGGTLGFLAILHTWDQLLRDHFHLHCLIPGGALSFDRSAWTPSSEKFLFRVERLAEVFRGKFLEGLKSQHAKGELLFPGKTAALGTPEGFSGRTEPLGGAKPPRRIDRRSGRWPRRPAAQEGCQILTRSTACRRT